MSTLDEYIEYFRYFDHPNGRDVAKVLVNRVGGGTVGESYVGDWDVRVCDLDTGKVLLEDRFRSGYPHTHAEAARDSLAFIEGYDL